MLFNRQSCVLTEMIDEQGTRNVDFGSTGSCRIQRPQKSLLFKSWLISIPQRFVRLARARRISRERRG
jgi:hypothetical protein